MRINGALEEKWKLCFHAKHVVSMENSLSDLFTRCKPRNNNGKLKRRRPRVNYHDQVMGGGERCSMILRGDMCSDVLRRQLGELTS